MHNEEFKEERSNKNVTPGEIQEDESIKEERKSIE